jgi:hypothetical protein
MLVAALTYAERGWPVLPLYSIANGRCTCGKDCSSPAKHPHTRHGVNDASRGQAHGRALVQAMAQQ